jgi:hypothetical protein
MLTCMYYLRSLQLTSDIGFDSSDIGFDSNDISLESVNLSLKI